MQQKTGGRAEVSEEHQNGTPAMRIRANSSPRDQQDTGEEDRSAVDEAAGLLAHHQGILKIHPQMIINTILINKAG